MSLLKEYWDKRRFDLTPEPRGQVVTGTAEPIFVVQKHQASRLHYDLRLEIDGVLYSWAVPQGPSLDTKVKRFARQTEHHPLEYAGFEGVIPDNQYGGGSMIVWDKGDWAPIADDPVQAMADGELKFRLAGERLSGGFTLVRLPEDPLNWLLIKERDPSAKPEAELNVTETYQTSVLTGRSIEELAPEEADAPIDLAEIKGVKPADFPKKFKPQLATKGPVPSGEDWVHEIKFDGYRTLVFVDHGTVRLITRNGLDWTERYGHLAMAFKALPCETAILDGETVVQNARGVSVLSELERALSDNRTHELTYFAFDLVHLDGFDLTGAALLERKAALKQLVAPVITANSPIQFSDHTQTHGPDFFSSACDMGLEGIISKKASGRYVQGRTTQWNKAKRVDTMELLVVGITVNSPRTVAALILAEETEEGLTYVCKVGSGFSDELRRSLFDELSAKPSLGEPLHNEERIPNATYIEPAFQARINYRGLSESGKPRQPSLVSLSDLAPSEAPKEPVKPRLVRNRDLAAIQLTNPDREIIEDSGNTKLDVAMYYAKVGDWMLPEIINRPVTLIRNTTGKAKDSFYQKHAFNGIPEGIEAVPVMNSSGEKTTFITVREPKGYLAMAQFGVIEFHPLNCTTEDLEHPDRIVLDLDPDTSLPWARVCDAAEEIRDAVEAIGFSPFLRTTGGKGVHIVLPIEKTSWADARTASKLIAQSMAKKHSALFSAKPGESNRKNRVFIDFLRNGRGSSSVGSYSLRANKDLTAAVPIDWETLRTLENSRAYTHRNLIPHLHSLDKDPWFGVEDCKIKIAPALLRDLG